MFNIKKKKKKRKERGKKKKIVRRTRIATGHENGFSKRKRNTAKSRTAFNISTKMKSNGEKKVLC